MNVSILDSDADIVSDSDVNVRQSLDVSIRCVEVSIR